MDVGDGDDGADAGLPREDDGIGSTFEKRGTRPNVHLNSTDVRSQRVLKDKNKDKDKEKQTQMQEKKSKWSCLVFGGK